MQPHIFSKFVSGAKQFTLEYWDVDGFSDLDFGKCRQVYGVCFYQKKMVIVFDKQRKCWSLPGGKPEKGENVETALAREIREETNTTVIGWKPVGVQKITEENGEWFYQYRVCCWVKPVGDFESDPAGAIGKIKFIRPLEYKKYFDWGEAGERIIRRSLGIAAVELKQF